MTGAPMSVAELSRLWADRSLSSAQIGARLGISGAAVRWRAKELGLPPRSSFPRPRKADPALFGRMWRAGVPVAEIAQYFGYASGPSVSAIARTLGLPRRGKGPSGRMNGGWAGGLSLAEFLETEARARMAEVAARESRVARRLWKGGEMKVAA